MPELIIAKMDAPTEPLAGTTFGNLAAPVSMQHAQQRRRFAAAGVPPSRPPKAPRRRLVTKVDHKDSLAFAGRAPGGVGLDAHDRRLHGAACRHRDSWHPLSMAVRR